MTQSLLEVVRHVFEILMWLQNQEEQRTLLELLLPVKLVELETSLKLLQQTSLKCIELEKDFELVQEGLYLTLVWQVSF